MSLQIKVNLQVEGIHCWPDAAEKCPESGYLQYPHRHMFHIEAMKNVTHSDRDVEIIVFKKQIISFLQQRYYDNTYGLCDFDSFSCEDLAKELVEKFQLSQCTVLEDGENGATCYAELN